MDNKKVVQKQDQNIIKKGYSVLIVHDKPKEEKPSKQQEDEDKNADEQQ